MSAAGTCFLCGSERLFRFPYLNMGSLGLVRGLAYKLPLSLGKGLARLSPRFARAWRPVETNRRYFDLTQCWCETCGTSWVEPWFEEARLSRYYEEYYWDNRDEAEGRHLADDMRPNDLQRNWSADRIAWFSPHVPAFASAIDFGAGDCAAGYLLRDQAKVIAVDPSTKAREIAARYGVEWRRTLAECPQVDLFYASHSLEHVHDLLAVFETMLGKVRPGGHLFFEVPNVSSKEVLTKLCHTPHTFAFSKGSFEQLASRFGIRIVAMEDVGGPWQIPGKTVSDPSKADLRVLFQR
ncbi:MAG TPA: class I SAM-dependent methyltransferase [Novosphingobium sp.]|nr:class I SAM-dependent methyltransferase [Novosphingobium sp.]